jgi:hypothetical protein
VVERFDEFTIEKYYERIRKHLEEKGVWEETIRKFPPQAIRNIIRRILERLDEYDMDYELIDWAVLFEGLRDFDNAEAFIKDLEAKNEIPKSKIDYTQELLAQYEKELHDLGYRIVSAKAYERYLLEKDKEIEIRRLRNKIRELEARIRELTKAVEEYEKQRKITMPLPPPKIETRITPLKNVITLDKFFSLCIQKLSEYNLPIEYVREIISEYRDVLTSSYEQLKYEQLNTFLDGLFNWLVSEVMKKEHEVVNGTILLARGVNVRRPQPIMVRYYKGMPVTMPPSISSLKPKFKEWAETLQKGRYDVKYDLVEIKTDTNIVVEASPYPPEKVQFLIFRNKLVGANVDCIAYNINEENKTLTLYFYKTIAYVINALTLR